MSLLAAALLLSSAEIRETANIEEILSAVVPGALVVFDIASGRGSSPTTKPAGSSRPRPEDSSGDVVPGRVALDRGAVPIGEPHAGDDDLIDPRSTSTLLVSRCELIRGRT